jgi:hypothetical protein
MRAVLMSAVLVTGCRIDLDENTSGLEGLCIAQDLPICHEADSHSDFEWIQKNIFSSNCGGKDCHGYVEDGTPDGKIVLTGALDPVNDPEGVMAAYRTLMGPERKGVVSDVAPTRSLVVPGNAEASYLYFLMHGVRPAQGEPPFDEPPDDVGYMPRRAKPLCCQKIEAVGRWIEAGALPPNTM